MNIVTALAEAVANGVLAVASIAVGRARLLILAGALVMLARQELAAHHRETRKFKVDHV